MKVMLLESLAALLVSTLVEVPLNETDKTTASPGASASVEFFDENRPLARELEMSIADGFTLAAVGDCIISRPLLQLQDPNFRAVVRILRDADVTFGNLETSIIDIRGFKGYPQAETDGWWLISSPETAKDLKAMGFDLLSRANNHTMDWGIEGMRQTTDWLDQAGLVHAGLGDHRAHARAARYLETEHGRVALVSVTSSFRSMAPAMPPFRQAPGRPGLNTIKTTHYTIVTDDVMRALCRARDLMAAQRESLEAGAAKTPEPRARELPYVLPRTFTFAGARCLLGERPGHTYTMDPIDLRDNIRSIRQGKQHSDFLIVSLHSHQSGMDPNTPADFQQKLAHAAIDAGADAFVGHGAHRLMPIEIYKGKPIFYSLGNFFWSDIHEPVAADGYEKYTEYLTTAFGDRDKATDADLNAILSAESYSSDTEENLAFLSVIAVSKYEKGRICEIRLYPVDLGYGMRLTQSGIPRTASPAVGRSILERLQQISRPYGTEIVIEDNVGFIRMNPQTSQ
jgi:poly-gamma-glutamate capsule biosynthesis protein CapA/YwtB (metallophosphatase superfamily)